MALLPGDKLGPYEFVPLTGKGGVGEVWKARGSRLHRIIAIQRLKGRHTALVACADAQVLRYRAIRRWET